MQQDASPWWQGAVFYQVYPRSFADGNGDGVGDLAGLLARLPYIAGLGVDAIWLSPVFTSPMKDFGYDVSDYCNIDPVFGTLADLDAVLARAHALGLRLIIDQVWSHSSSQHPWFTQSRASRDNPRANWYVWADPKPDGSPPNNWLAVFGGIAWAWEPRRRQYYLHNFLPEQPDLNLHEPAVQDAILDVARFWLDRGVDGFRLDVANFFMHDAQLRDNPPAGNARAVKPYDMQRHVYDRSRPENLHFIARIRQTLDGYVPARMSVGELPTSQPVLRMAEYTGNPQGLHTAYSFVFLGGALRPARLRATLSELLEQAPGAWPSWAFENHDVTRSVTRWLRGGDAPATARMLLTLLLCLRGTIFLYQGQELGLTEAELPFAALRDPDGIAFWPEHKGRDGCRTPIPWAAEAPHGGFSTATPWLPVPPAHLPLAVNCQESDPRSTLAHARAILTLRRAHPALRLGDIAFAADQDDGSGLLIFTRSWQGRQVICLFNLGEAPASAPLPAAAKGERATPPPPGLAMAQNAMVAGDGGITLQPCGFALFTCG